MPVVRQAQPPPTDWRSRRTSPVAVARLEVMLVDLARGPLQQVGNEVRQASTFVVGPFLEALGKMPRQGGADPLRFAVKQVRCCIWSSRAPTVLRE